MPLFDDGLLQGLPQHRLEDLSLAVDAGRLANGGSAAIQLATVFVHGVTVGMQLLKEGALGPPAVLRQHLAG